MGNCGNLEMLFLHHCPRSVAEGIRRISLSRIYFADRTLAIFEATGDRLPVPSFAEAFVLTVGELFQWLEN